MANETTNGTYLPSGTRVAIRDSKGETRWYNTKKDVDLTGDEKTVPDPMETREGQTVLTLHKDGWDLFFLPSQVRNRVSAEEEKRVRDLNLYQLVYDVPSRATVEHPSNWLHRIAVRYNLSCWIIPKEQIPWVRLHGLTEAGVDWDVKKFDPSEAGPLLDKIISRVRREVEEAAQGMEESRARAEEILTAEGAEANRVATRKKYLARMEHIEKRYKAVLVELDAAAKIFGINARALGREKATAAINATKVGMRERAAAWFAAANAIEASKVAGSKAMADQLRNGEVPAGVAADFLQETGAVGSEAVADSLRSVEGDGTFSLTDGTDEAA